MIIGTWLTIVIYSAVVLFAAVVFTGIISSGNRDSETQLIVGYFVTLFLFSVFLLGLCFSILGTFSWAWRKRYSVPLNLQPTENIELQNRG
jgi:hypothetical protein